MHGAFIELRERHGYRRSINLAATANVSPTAVFQFDTYNDIDPRWSTLTAISGAMGVTPQVVMQAVRKNPHQRKRTQKRVA